MPTYKVTDPDTGKSVSLTGDSPPTESELNDIFSTVHGQNEKSKYQVPAQSKLGMALDVAKGTWNANIPVLGDVVESLRNSVPNYIAEKTGAIGEKVGGPVGKAIKGYGVAESGILGTAAEFAPKTAGDLAIMGLSGPASEAASAVAGKVAPTVISKLTRIEEPVVSRYISKVGKGAKDIFNKEIQSPEWVENAVSKISSALKEGRSAVGKKLGAIEDRVAAKYPDKFIPVQDIGSDLANNLKRASFEVQGDATGEVSRKLESDTADILNDFSRKSTPGLAGEAATPSNMTLRDAIGLRRKIDDAVDFTERMAGKETTESALLKQARNKLNQRILPVDPKLRAANGAAAAAYSAYDDLMKNVFAPNAKAETVSKRLTGLLNKGSAERKVLEKADMIGGRSSGMLDQLLDSLTAQKFQPVINPVVERAATQTGGGILGASGIGGATAALAATGHPGALALEAGALAATSPKLHALAIQAATRPIGAAQLQGLPQATAAAIQALRRYYGQ